MDPATRAPLSHTLWSPHDTVKDAAESLGMTLPDDAAKNLAMDVEYRIHEILETAIKFMRHSKRRLLRSTDLNQALHLLNIEPLYGYDNSQPVQFKEALVGQSGQTLYYLNEKEVDLERLINQELPRIPRQTTFTAHWLAIEGVQPLIPQNPLPADIMNTPPIIRGAVTSTLGKEIASTAVGDPSKGTVDRVASNNRQLTDKDAEIKPLVKHVLSKELRLYFDKVVQVLLSTYPESEQLKYAALNSLKVDPGLHQLVPYFIQFIAEQITNQLRNIDVLSTMLAVISALADNKTIFLDPYIHALMPCILTLLLAKKIGPTINMSDTEEVKETFRSQLAIREFAAILLDHVIQVYGSSYSTLKLRITRTLLKAFLDTTKPTGTHYGALLALKNMGNEVIKLIVIGNLKMWYKLVIEDDNKTEMERDILKNLLLEIFNTLLVKVEASSSSTNSNQTLTDDGKNRLFDRLGEPLANLILEQPNALEIARGVFFGEAVI